MVFLKISQNSQEITCVGVLQANFIKKETLKQVLSCEFCEIFKNTFFTEQLRWLLLYFEERSSSPEVFCKKGVLKFFAKFRIPHLSASTSQLSNPKGRISLIFKRNVKTKAWERFVYLWFQKETTRKSIE